LSNKSEIQEQKVNEKNVEKEEMISTRFLWIHRWPELSSPADTICFCYHCLSHPFFFSSLQWRIWYDEWSFI